MLCKHTNIHVTAIVKANKTHMLHPRPTQIKGKKRLPMRQLVKAAIIDRISMCELILTYNTKRRVQITKHKENGSSSHCVDITSRDFKNTVGTMECIENAITSRRKCMAEGSVLGSVYGMQLV